MAEILYGKPVADFIYQQCGTFNGETVVFITIGEDIPSKIYVRKKIEACKKVGLNPINIRFNEDIDVHEVHNKIHELNMNREVIGIMVQKPYPVKFKNIEQLIDVYKDIDGLTMKNMYKTLIGQTPRFYPATAFAISSILDYYNIDIRGKQVTVIGRSMLVGRPIAAMLDSDGATVTVCHSKTPKEILQESTISADIIISAVGKPKIFNKIYLDTYLNNTVIIDVASCKDKNGKTCGDWDYNNVIPHVRAITPPIGGVGPVTVSCIVLACGIARNLNK